MTDKLMEELGLQGFGDEPVVSGTGFFTTSMSPGEKIKVRFLSRGYLGPKSGGVVHQVPKPGPDEGDAWIPCPGEEACRQLTIYDGRILHDLQSRLRYRGLVYNHTSGQVEILEQGKGVYGAVSKLDNSDEWGDIRTYDIIIECIPAPPPYSKNYTVVPARPVQMTKETIAKIKEQLPPVKEALPFSNSIETVKEKLAALTGEESGKEEGPSFDSGIGSPDKEETEDKGSDTEGMPDFNAILGGSEDNPLA